jgi:protein arginine N-methyltransferase 3
MESESSSEEQQQQWDEWVDDSQEKTKGLFCDRYFKSPADCWKNCLDEFGWDHDNIYLEWKLNEYQHIQLVNYIRTQQTLPDFSASQLIASLKESAGGAMAPWKNENFLIPVLTDDSVFCDRMWWIVMILYDFILFYFIFVCRTGQDLIFSC